MTQQLSPFQSVLYLLLAFVLSCSEPAPSRMQSGRWEILFDVGDETIPIRLQVTSDSVWDVVNADERISLKNIQWKGNHFHVKMPYFNSDLQGERINQNELIGTWTDYSRDSSYSIPFTARFVHQAEPAPLKSVEERIYAAEFSPQNPDDRTTAIGVFQYQGTRMWGTFLTETGDFRYLEGLNTGNSMYLSCFDGAHLFYFCANQSGDSLTDGMFYSGKHWSEEWQAVLDPAAKLRNPDSLTVLVNPQESLEFTARAMNGDSITFSQENFKNKVSIVQIFGSWCPNCTDESLFLKNLHNKYSSKGLQIIPVGFERATEFEAAKNAIEEQFDELGLPYRAYVGGLAGKNNASRVFSNLNEVMSYPTSIFIDKKGKVRKIHTGFYGPGTGKHYRYHSEMLDMFVVQLLNE